MAVNCAQCGEELMGAVNRCWRCGTELASRPGDVDLPPVRQSPVVAPPRTSTQEAAVPAVIVDGETEATTSEAAHDAGHTIEQSGELPPVRTQPRNAREEEARAAGYDRIGSPFAVAGDLGHHAQQPSPSPAQHPSPVEMPVYPRHAAATGGAVASFVIGLLSALGVILLMQGLFLSAIGTLLTSVLGIVLGLWGIYSPRKGFAIAGLLICCITLALSGFFGTVELYEAIYDKSPWITEPSEFEGDFDSEF